MDIVFSLAAGIILSTSAIDVVSPIDMHGQNISGAAEISADTIGKATSEIVGDTFTLDESSISSWDDLSTGGSGVADGGILEVSAPIPTELTVTRSGTDHIDIGLPNDLVLSAPSMQNQYVTGTANLSTLIAGSASSQTLSVTSTSANALTLNQSQNGYTQYVYATDKNGVNYGIGWYNSKWYFYVGGTNYLNFGTALDVKNTIRFADGSDEYLQMYGSEMVMRSGNDSAPADIGLRVYDDGSVARLRADHGIYIGSNTSGYLIDDATNGASSSPLYIGNLQISASFSAGHFYPRGDMDLQAGECVVVANGRIWRATIEGDRRVKGIYEGTPRHYDSKGLIYADQEVEAFPVVDEASKVIITYKPTGNYILRKKPSPRTIQEILMPDQLLKADRLDKLIADPYEDFPVRYIALGDSFEEPMLKGAWILPPVQNGDLLISAKRAGWLKAAPDDIIRANVIGQAMEDYTEPTKAGMIELMK